MSKVKITITADDVKGSESGQELHFFAKGETYEVTQEFANVLVNGELAEYTKGNKTEKAVDDAPENKVIESAPENKTKSKRKKK